MNKLDFIKHDTLCPLPWTSIFVNPDGGVRNCAISAQELGNIHDQPLPDILHGSVNVGIKQDMLMHVKHARCNACYQVESTHQAASLSSSNRSWYKKIAIRNLDLTVLDSANNFNPLILDLRWRNTCNRACVYCGPDVSSLWSDILQQQYRINDQTLEKSKQYVYDHLHLVKHIYLAGGEPLLIKENQYLLEKLLPINPDVEIRVNSNIGNINTPVFDLLTKFTNVKWTVSLDSKDQSFEYLRWPGQWSEFWNNLKTVQSIVNDQINFNMVWCILNSEDIFDTVDYLLDNGFHENMFVIQCLTHPEPLSVLHLPVEEKIRIKSMIMERKTAVNSEWWLYRSLGSMYNFLDTPAPDSVTMFYDNQTKFAPGLPGTFEFLQKIDEIRGTSAVKIFPRLFQYQ